MRKYRKDGFAETSKNLVRDNSRYNLVGPIK